ncbi:MAG: hypothetical protein V4527_01855 [Pseudomonadota bacterium]
MTATAHYFISSSNRAYRSEISLFRHEKAAAEDCWMIHARAGASRLFEIVGRGERVTVTAYQSEAWKRFKKDKALELHSITVVD